MGEDISAKNDLNRGSDAGRGLSSAVVGERINSGTDAHRVVTARGTENGLVLRIDGRADWSEIRHDLEAFLGSRKSFLEGGEVSVEWLDRLPTLEQSRELELLLREQFGIEVMKRRRASARTKAIKDRAIQQGEGRGIAVPLFDDVGVEPPSENVSAVHLSKQIEVTQVIEEPPMTADAAGGRAEDGEFKLEEFNFEDLRAVELSRSVEVGKRSDRRSGIDQGLEDFGRDYVMRMTKVLGEDLFYDEEANAKIVFGTLRSGQRVETPFSLIVVGDVNPGADLIAGGDVIVLGSLRGTAHASAYDDDGTNRVIIAQQMRPMQLRIGGVISRGSEDQGKSMEIAHIEDRRIVVEPYHGKLVSGKLLVGGRMSAGRSR